MTYFSTKLYPPTPPFLCQLSDSIYWKKMSWEEAKMYCFSLNDKGIVGWRLPTLFELNSIILLVSSPLDDHEFEIWSEENAHDIAWFMSSRNSQRLANKLMDDIYCIPVRDLKDD
jgi:hypothetical protein